MKNKLPTVLLGLSLITLFGFNIGQEVELTTFLNGRADPDFLKYTKNIKTLLDKGTTGEVVEVKKFSSGNSGIKMKINGGPKNGESYWVYYSKENPALKLTDKKTKTDVPVEAARPKETQATVTREIAASRDLAEHAVIETARAAALLDAKKISAATSLQGDAGCSPAEVSKVATATEVEQKSDRPYSAAAALSDLNSEELKFTGRDLMPGSGQNRSCIFQNSKVVVIYDNCMSSKKEAPATDIKIISKAGGEVGFYVENATPGSVSKMRREQYDSTWRFGFVATKAPAATTVAGIKKYMEENENTFNYCYIGTSFEAKKTAKAHCSDNVQGDKDKWTTEAEAFWNNPPESWYTTQAKLRKLVEKAPY